jgi:lipopolysaccharide/colanic/teichoic acid biosynthesis glycosyltransferase
MTVVVQKLVLPVLCFALAFHLINTYERRRGSASDSDVIIGRALALTAVMIFALYVAIPPLWPSEAQLLTVFVLLLGASHLYFALRGRVRSVSSNAATSKGRSVLVIGKSAVVLAAAREIERRGYTVLRYAGRNGEGSSGQSLRTLARASQVVAETKIVRIIVGLLSSAEELPLRQLLEQRLGGVPVETGHEAYERLTGKIFLDERTPLHLLVSHACLSSRLYSSVKRCVSAVVAAVVLVPALPVMGLIALCIRWADRGAVLFVQERVGVHGRPFRLLKFRTMGNEKDSPSEWERDNENRITTPGRWLRKLHLDELPQLWNILRGDMDLVGPRPHPVSNYELFARSIPYYSLRSLVRPGLTGWAQVRQGYAQDLTGEIEKMRYDLCAIARPSLRRDLWVLLATAKILLLGQPLGREGSRTAERRHDSVAIPVSAAPAPAPRHGFELARAFRTVSARKLDTPEPQDNPGQELDNSTSPTKGSGLS